MRKKKDIEATRAEEKKILEYKKSIEEKEEQKKAYEIKASKIEKKVKSMKKFEEFLEKVKDANPDEFPEL